MKDKKKKKKKKKYTTYWSLNFCVETNSDAENGVPPTIPEVLTALKAYMVRVEKGATIARDAMGLPCLEWDDTNPNEEDFPLQGSGSTDPSKE